MRRLRYAILALALALVAGLSAPAEAISLQAARSQGLVGETRSGFVAAVTPPSDEVRALVNEVNGLRRKEYQRIAEQNGVGLEQVGRLTAEKLINGLPAGVFYQDTSGDWRRK